MMLLRHLTALVCAAQLGAAQPAPGEIAEARRIADSPANANPRNAYTVSSFEIKSRWSGKVSLPLKPGDAWTPEKQSEVLAAIQQAFNHESSFSYLLGQAGMASVLYVSIDEQKDESSRTVHLVVRPLRVKLSLAKLGDNVLPIPRSAFPTRYETVPRWLLALNPSFGVSYDQAFGTAFSAGIHSDLLTLSDLLAAELPGSENPHHLDTAVNATRSLEKFHRENASLAYAYRRLGGRMREFFIGATYEGAKEPLGGQEHRAEIGGADSGITFKLAAHTRLTFNTGYQQARDELRGGSSLPKTTTDIQSNRLIVESILPSSIGGFFRGAIWQDNGWTDRNFGAHQRLVGRAGYAREIALSPNRTVGIELIAGGGYLWGNAPASRHFFGGNASGQFLYDNVAGAELRELPNGPLLRSFGRGEAVGAGGINGGRSFWHVNANLTLPIRSWSFPLIPADEEIRNRLKNGINVTGRSFLITALKQQGLSREDAVKEADRTLAEIRPATAYIIEEANLYSIKPLLMFDAGGLSAVAGNASWLAAGGGVQVNIVTAKFELGYMRTLRGPIGDNRRGNLFFRLVFQNLF